jgi:hypothetical protein
LQPAARPRAHQLARAYGLEVKIHRKLQLNACHYYIREMARIFNQNRYPKSKTRMKTGSFWASDSVVRFSKNCIPAALRHVEYLHKP